MLRLINANLASTRQGQRRKFSPTLLAHFRDRYLLCLEISQCRREIVAHKKEFVAIVVLRIMECSLQGRHGENQPAMTSVNIRELEHIAKEGPVGFSILGIDNDMGTVDQRTSPRARQYRLIAVG